MKVIIYEKGCLTFTNNNNEDKLRQISIRYRQYSDNKHTIIIQASNIYLRKVYEYSINFFSLNNGQDWAGKYSCKYNKTKTQRSQLLNVKVSTNGQLKIEADWLEDSKVWKMKLTASKGNIIDCDDSEQPFETIFDELR